MTYHHDGTLRPVTAFDAPGYMEPRLINVWSKAVAVRGHVDDWAAYCGRSDWTDGMTASQGDRLDQEEAARLFPVWAEHLSYRR
mgnify:CR=1 FL=1